MKKDTDRWWELAFSIFAFIAAVYAPEQITGVLLGVLSGGALVEASHDFARIKQEKKDGLLRSDTSKQG